MRRSRRLEKIEHQPLPDPREMKLMVRPMDLAVMIHNMYEAANHPEIGWTDSERTIDWILKDMNKKPAKIKRSLVESALYFCNLMSEQGAFWHPQGATIEQFVSNVIKVTNKPYYFDREFNLLIEDKR